MPDRQVLIDELFVVQKRRIEGPVGHPGVIEQGVQAGNQILAAGAPVQAVFGGFQVLGFLVIYLKIVDQQLQIGKPIAFFQKNFPGDDGVGGSRLSYQMLRSVQAADVRYHEYKNQDHVIDDFAYFTEGFMDWLFAQKKVIR